MKRLAVVLVVLLATLFAALPAVAGSQARTYEVTLLDFPGAGATYFDGANGHGQAVGGYFDAAGGHAFLYDNGDFVTLPVEDSPFSFAFDINDRGDIVGFYANENFEFYGFLLDRHGEFISLAVPGAVETSASGINNSGVIVGIYTEAYPAVYRGFKWADGVLTYPIDVPPPDPGLPAGITDIHEINEKGQIVGSVTDFATYSYAFIMEPDGTINYYPPEDTLAHESAFRGINNRGQVVGSLDDKFWLYDRGETVLIDMPGAFYSTINAIGAEGTMFGWTSLEDGVHGVMIDR